MPGDRAHGSADDRAFPPGPAHTFGVMARVVVPALGAALLLAACTPSTPSPHLSRLTVHASASVIHNRVTYTQSFRGRSAVAVGSDGKKFTGTFDGHGTAILRLPPGRYQVTTSVAQVCSPAHATIPARGSEITLTCGLP